MTLLKDISSCSTYAVRGLDLQLIAKVNQLSPGALVRIDDLPVIIGGAAHSFLQPEAKSALVNVLKLAKQAGLKKQLTINSALRTLSGQALLRKHYETGRCGIRAAARPGNSNHEDGTAIDIEDSTQWRGFLQKCGWEWIGAFDPMHYDFRSPRNKNVSVLMTKAFQLLWSETHPKDKLEADGAIGMATMSKLVNSPAEGFAGLEGMPRLLKFTEPLQTGKDVGKLQLALRAQGVKIDTADGIFGAATFDAVQEFQRDKGLAVDGVVGTGTLVKLGLKELLWD